MKACSKCFEIKEFGEFNIDNRVPDGHHYYCKACYYADRKLKAYYYPKVAQKSYRKNRVKIMARRRAYAEANKDKLYKRSRELYDINREKINKRACELYHLRGEEMRQRHREYYVKNKALIRERAYKRIYGPLAGAFKAVHTLQKEIEQWQKKENM